MTAADDSVTVRAAAILDDGAVDADALLAAVACQQRRAGRRVRGLVMTHPDDACGCAEAMVLVDLETLDEYLVSQPLGSAAVGCRADPQGFARASQVLRRAADETPDLVISNRFGNQEAEGRGFRAELLEILALGLPLLTVVTSRHLDAWRQFSGGAAVLPARPDAIAAWLRTTLGAVDDAAPPARGPAALHA
ncbi:MAG: DUF2478 domain-containing protein [Proteobacteria bacterium]|nr:DUF2478 domain-containing protein [Pseudomonadota bacterium]